MSGGWRIRRGEGVTRAEAAAVAVRRCVVFMWVSVVWACVGFVAVCEWVLMCVRIGALLLPRSGAHQVLRVGRMSGGWRTCRGESKGVYVLCLLGVPLFGCVWISLRCVSGSFVRAYRRAPPPYEWGAPGAPG